jgi:hypothetical protein
MIRPDIVRYRQLKAGSVLSFKIHLDGLEALVKSVGGLQALLVSPFNSQVRQLVSQLREHTAETF